MFLPLANHNYHLGNHLLSDGLGSVNFLLCVEMKQPLTLKVGGRGGGVEKGLGYEARSKPRERQQMFVER